MHVILSSILWKEAWHAHSAHVKTLCYTQIATPHINLRVLKVDLCANGAGAYTPYTSHPLLMGLWSEFFKNWFLFSHSKGNVTISRSIHLTLKSDLNGENPQFTLICVSTGGPATNVTWTRDSEEVLGGVTVLDNTVTAQYTHTLTVTGRLPGQYQCTVSNNKPSTANKSFTMEGGVIVLWYVWCCTSTSHHASLHLFFFF